MMMITTLDHVTSSDHVTFVRQYRLTTVSLPSLIRPVVGCWRPCDGDRLQRVVAGIAFSMMSSSLEQPSHPGLTCVFVFRRSLPQLLQCLRSNSCDNHFRHFNCFLLHFIFSSCWRRRWNNLLMLSSLLFQRR